MTDWGIGVGAGDLGGLAASKEEARRVFEMLGDDEWFAKFGGLLIGRGEGPEEPAPPLQEEPAPTVTNG